MKSLIAVVFANLVAASAGACTIMSNTAGIIGDVRGGQVISYGSGIRGHITGNQVINNKHRLVGYVSGRDVVRSSMYGQQIVARIENSQIITVPDNNNVGNGMGCDNVELGAAYLLMF